MRYQLHLTKCHDWLTYLMSRSPELTGYTFRYQRDKRRWVFILEANGEPLVEQPIIMNEENMGPSMMEWFKSVVGRMVR